MQLSTVRQSNDQPSSSFFRIVGGFFLSCSPLIVFSAKGFEVPTFGWTNGLNCDC